MANLNVTTITDQDSGKQLVREYLDKSLLERRDWDGVLANSKWADTKPLPAKAGEYIEFTRKGRARRPQKMASPGGAGSDPLSGISLGTTKKLLPIEWIQDYAAIAVVSQTVSWIDIKQWAKEDMPVALKRRMHELTQNSFITGRMAPGVYAADGTLSTGFDQAAEATVTLYGVSFTFESAPAYYGRGKTKYSDLTSNDTLTWNDIRARHVGLSNSGAPKISGDKGPGYGCCLSEAQWNDLLHDDDDGLLASAIQSGNFKAAVDGITSNSTFFYAGTYFMIDDQPFTSEMGDGNDVKRADFGKVHAALMFGRHAFGYMPIRNSETGKLAFSQFGATPNFKVQDITKTGYEITLGYLVPWQVGILNRDWCCYIQAPVTHDKPNNYDPADPDKQMEGFLLK
jgi:hypothetical protein